MKYVWVTSNKKYWPTSLSCERLGVSTSGYFENMRRKGTGKPSKPGANKQINDEALWTHIRVVHAEIK